MIFLFCLIFLNIFIIFVVVFYFVVELYVLGGFCDFIFVLFDFFKFIWFFVVLGSRDLKKKVWEFIVIYVYV